MADDAKDFLDKDIADLDMSDAEKTAYSSTGTTTRNLPMNARRTLPRASMRLKLTALSSTIFLHCSLMKTSGLSL